MINSMLGIFLILASFLMGYWSGVQRVTLPKARSSESADKPTRPTFKSKTPFSKLRDKEKV